MSAGVTNNAVRQINCNENGEISWGEWSTSLDNFRAGSYNSENKYVAQIRFRLDKPCSSITLKLTTYAENAYGTTYWKVSENENDEALARASYNPGQGYDVSTKFTGSGYEEKTVTIEGTFPADKDLYLYGFNYAAGNDWSCVAYYAMYSDKYCTRVTGGTEIAGTASTVALSGGVLGSPVTIQISRDNADFVHSLTWSFAGQSGAIAEKTADTLITWTPDANTFGGYIPNASSAALTVSCVTYMGAEQIGQTQTAALTMSLPSDAAPAVSSGWAAVGYSNLGTKAEGIAACIAGYSKATVTFDESKVTARYGAVIKSLTAKLGGSSVTGSGTLGTVSAAANNITVTATDSRGKSTSAVLSLSAHAYSLPALSGVAVFRCDASGAAADSGAYYSAKAVLSFSSAGGAISCGLTAAIKLSAGSYGGETALTSGSASVLGGSLSDTASYVVRIKATDSLGNEAVVEVTIPTASCAFNIREGGDGIGLGKYAESAGMIDSAWPIRMNGNKLTGLGTPADAGDAVPLGWATGFGLGAVVGQELTPETIDSAKNNGWYGYYDSTYTNWIPGVLWSHRGLIEVKAWERVTWQYFYLPNSGCVARRYITEEWGSTWSEWECLNPPMSPGVEYRTTERHQGKVVYTKLIDCGTLPNAGVKRVTHGAGATSVLRVAGITSEGSTIAYTATDTIVNRTLSASVTYITIYSQYDSSGITGYAQIWYTKD